jgi:hypothetical protein
MNLLRRLWEYFDRPITAPCCPRHDALARGRRIGGGGW